MTTKYTRKGSTLTVWAITILALTTVMAASAAAQSISLHAAHAVNVQVSFSTQLALPDMSDQTLASTQKRGREFIYRLGREECAVLRATIAETCQLTNLNVSAQIRDHHHQRPVKLYFSGSAQFTITLKNY